MSCSINHITYGPSIGLEPDISGSRAISADFATSPPLRHGRPGKGRDPFPGDATRCYAVRRLIRTAASCPRAALPTRDDRAIREGARQGFAHESGERSESRVAVSPADQTRPSD